MNLYYKIELDTEEIKTGGYFEEGQQPEGYVLSDGIDRNKLMYDKVNLVFYEGATTKEIQNEHILKLLEIETNKYIQRAKDGQNYYAGISAKFRLAKLSGQISEEEHAIKESACIPLRNEILAGQWVSGFNLLVEMGSSIIGQDLYNELFNIINNYINSSYTIEEINKINKTQTKK